MSFSKQISFALLLTIGMELWFGRITAVRVRALVRERGPIVEGQFPGKRPFTLPSNWKGIIPLRSTRSDVEKILGQPRESQLGPHIYENQTERVDVLYARGKCERGTGRWNVPAETVIQIQITPAKILLLEDISIDRIKYTSYRWSHPDNWITYQNKQDGIWIDTIDLGKNTEEVRVIKYLPKASDHGLKCASE